MYIASYVLGQNISRRKGVSFTLTLPILLEIDEATSIERADMIPVTEKIEPSVPSARLNLRLKKYVTQDLFDTD